MANPANVNVNVAEIQQLMQRMGRKLGGPEQLIAYSFFKEAQDPIKQFISKHILTNLRAGATKTGREADIEIAKKRIESRGRMSESERLSLDLRSDISGETSKAITGIRETGTTERQDIESGDRYERGMRAIDIEESEIVPKLVLGGAKVAIDYGTAERKRIAATTREDILKEYLGDKRIGKAEKEFTI